MPRSTKPGELRLKRTCPRIWTTRRLCRTLLEYCKRNDTLHLITWFRIALRQGKTREESVIQAMRNCGMAMTQTALVIALSLLLLYPAELLLISRFGWVLAALLAVAWLSSVVVLPALLAGPLGRVIESMEIRGSRATKNARHRRL